jgi:hypothetical protein
VKRVIAYARQTLGNLPILNVAAFVVERAGIMIEQRRTFHQNLMIHYLENFPAEELKLDDQEVQLILSSVYESRIPWNAPWMANYAKQHWADYGKISLSNTRMIGDMCLKKNQVRYERGATRLNFAFETVTERTNKGTTRKIVNLYDKQSMFSSRPSDAYFLDQPKKVERQRRLIRLAQLGLRFLALPQFLVQAMESYMQSMYVNQTKTEGAMYGYFESNGNGPGMSSLSNQTLNPLIAADLAK